MIKNITCIECPKSCKLSIDVQDGKAVSITGNQCKKGLEYAKAEIEDPQRILTSTVKAEGLELKMVPVRTDKPIPKEKMFEAMEEIKRTDLAMPVNIGQVIRKDFVVQGVNLIATRSVG